MNPKSIVPSTIDDEIVDISYFCTIRELNFLGVSAFVTTFSNSPCFSNYCLRQSYPESYPFENNPKKGNNLVDLPKKCKNSYLGGNTTLYKIEKGFRHSGNAVVIRFYDELYQPNAIDKDGVVQSKCDESWSLDNLKVRVISYN